MDYYYKESKGENVLDLETRTVGLKFQTEDSHFQRKDKTLSLICSATVADRTRSKETKAYLSIITKEKYAQTFGNSGKIFFILIYYNQLSKDQSHFFFPNFRKEYSSVFSPHRINPFTAIVTKSTKKKKSIFCCLDF